jgi:uncharacterized protein
MTSETANRSPFLTASWRNLLLLNYATDPQVLRKYLPKNCDLDLLDGKAFVSLVAFQFRNTKVKGIKWPGFVNFPEVNLRFYIRHNGKRGVCFIKEYVPSLLVSSIARIIYNEPYKKARMTEDVRMNDEEISAVFSLDDGPNHLIAKVCAENSPYLPKEDSIEHFFKEHELGVGSSRRGELVTYNVHHPVWRIYPIKSFRLDIDAEGLYGKDFGFLATEQPHSLVFAEGSDITVFDKD